ncbi:MAG: hypothetical protein O2943_09080 [Actinomycetota bacterium]|nr:hypothetical protein [Actinomycetota bacterium]
MTHLSVDDAKALVHADLLAAGLTVDSDSGDSIAGTLVTAEVADRGVIQGAD